MNIFNSIPNDAQVLPKSTTRRFVGGITGQVGIFLLLVVGTFLSSASADELVLDESNNGIFKRGDFDCQQCKEPIDMGLLIPRNSAAGDESSEISAGDLYRFFKKQGINSIEHLVFCFDVNPNGNQKSDVGLENLKLTIGDPFDPTNLREFSLGENSLMMPAYETSQLKPEARVEIALGYDFMERYSENSTEKIRLDFKVNGSDPLSIFVPAEKSINWFSGPRLALVIGFVAFWVILFWILFRFTNPGSHEKQNKQHAAAA